MSLVRVARFTDLNEARVVEAALQSAGIPVFVQNAQFGQTDYAAQFALGGFAVMTPEEYAQDAAAFIRAHRTAQPVHEAAQDEPHEPVPDEEIMAHADDEEDEDEAWAQARQRRKRNGTRWFVTVCVGVPLFGSIIAAIISIVQKMIHGG